MTVWYASLVGFSLSGVASLRGVRSAVWVVFMVGFAMCPAVFAQSESAAALQRARQNISLTGAAGFTTEAYTTTGDSRRPPLSGRAFTNVSLNAFGLQTGFNLLYSTEENRLQQSLNQIGLDASWRWLRVQAGDTYPQFSRYSLSGARVQGGVVELSPGILRLGVAVGRNQKAFDPTTQTSTTANVLGQVGRYKRWISAVRLGLGDEQQTHFHLIGLSARDDTTSIAWRDESVRPAENLSVTVLSGISLFKRRFFVKGEGTISAFNRNLFATKIETDEFLDPDSTVLPSSLLPVARFALTQFTPTVGSSVSYAGHVTGRVRLKALSLSGQYTQVGPGFASLGLYTLRNDYAEWRVQPNLSLMKGRITIGGQYGQWYNNLTDLRTTEQVRERWGTNVRVQATSWFTISGRMQQSVSEVHPTIDPAITLRRNTTQNISISPIVSLRRGTRIHTISLNLSLQRFSNKARATGEGAPAPDLDYSTVNANATWFGNLTQHLDANVASNVMVNQTANGDNTVLGFTSGLTRSWFERKLSVGFMAGATRNAQAAQQSTFVLTQLNGSLNAQYRVTQFDNLRLTVRGVSNKSNQPGFAAFREMRMQLTYRRRF